MSRRSYSGKYLRNARYKFLTRFLVLKYGGLYAAADKLGYPYSTLHLLLYGGNPRKGIIDAIISDTGLTYKEAFREDFEFEQQKEHS